MNRETLAVSSISDVDALNIASDTERVIITVPVAYECDDPGIGYDFDTIALSAAASDRMRREGFTFQDAGSESAGTEDWVFARA